MVLALSAELGFWETANKQLVIGGCFLSSFFSCTAMDVGRSEESRALMSLHVMPEACCTAYTKSC